jgi:hypothetical protein
MAINIFLDDERFPPRDNREWLVARSVTDAQALVAAYGFPACVYFDNDLGDHQPEGWRFAQWLIDRDLDAGQTLMANDFEFFAHSRNPVRQQDIMGRLTRYLDYKRTGR